MKNFAVSLLQTLTVAYTVYLLRPKPRLVFVENSSSTYVRNDGFLLPVDLRDLQRSRFVQHWDISKTYKFTKVTSMTTPIDISNYLFPHEYAMVEQTCVSLINEEK